MTPSTAEAATVEAATVEAATKRVRRRMESAMKAATVEAATTVHLRDDGCSRKGQCARAEEAGDSGPPCQSFHSFRKSQHLRSPSFSHAQASPEPPIST